MKYEPIPITPTVITWARERAGVSLDGASMKFKAIRAWEAGEASPSYPQLEKMADEFYVPLAVFFFPEPPDIPPISESFRTLLEQNFEHLPPRMLFLLRKAKAFQINLSELTGGKNPAPRIITRDLSFRTNASIQSMAKRVREYLGVSIETQCEWPADDEAFKQWRQMFQEVGVSVFKDQFREIGYSGFCLYDDEFPLIYVNNTTAKTRQIFTLFHELAHLIFHTSGIDGLADDFINALPHGSQKIEIICNRFAAEFLLPEKIFETAASELSPTEETAETLASRFHVSREFIYRKFLDRGWISQSTYEAAAKKWADQQSGKSGGNPYYTKISYLGQDYINLAFSQYYQNRIDENQLADYLDIKPRHLSTFEAYVM